MPGKCSNSSSFRPTALVTGASSGMGEAHPWFEGAPAHAVFGPIHLAYAGGTRIRASHRLPG